MRSDWRQFLSRVGAVFEDGVVERFGEPRAETRAAAESDVVADLSHTATIAVTGKDAPAFLQGQLTNDIEAVTESTSQLSAWCSIKGRVVVRFRVWRHPDGYWLELPAPQVQSTLDRLRLYVLRAKVEIEDVSDRWIKLGLCGERAAARLQETVPDAPAQPDQVVQGNRLTVIRLLGERPRFSLVIPPEEAPEHWQRLSAIATPVGAGAWRSLDIHAGVADVPPAVSDAFIPQMLNLQAVNGMSFTKGCYTGQEIVARTEHLGRLKRRMFLAHVDAEQSPNPSDPLYAGSGDQGRSVGTVVSASAAPAGGWDLLAVIRIESVEARVPIHLCHVLGPELQLRALPYSLESRAA